LDLSFLGDTGDTPSAGRLKRSFGGQSDELINELRNETNYTSDFSSLLATKLFKKG